MKFRLLYCRLLICLLLVSAGSSLLLFRQARIYYTQLNAARLDPLGLLHFPTPAPPASGFQPLLAFYGDSRAEQWPPPQVIVGATQNFGIGGQTTAQILARFDHHFASVKPKIILIQAGINDLKTIPLFPLEEAKIILNCKQNLAAMVNRARLLGARVILTTIFPLGELPLLRRPFWSDRVEPAITEVNHYLISLAAPEVTVVVTADLLTDRQGHLIPAYSHDLLHLSIAGYQRLNQELSARLKSILVVEMQP